MNSLAPPTVPKRCGNAGANFKVLNHASELFRIRNNSEALFKTLKYGPEFPERFASVHDAGTFISGFVDWYNHHHQHSGIGFHTAANVHYGHAVGVARERSATLATARAKHPERFTTTTDPKILALPGPAWINQPKEITENSAA